MEKYRVSKLPPGLKSTNKKISFICNEYFKSFAFILLYPAYIAHYYISISHAYTPGPYFIVYFILPYIVVIGILFQISSTLRPNPYSLDDLNSYIQEMLNYRQRLYSFEEDERGCFLKEISYSFMRKKIDICKINPKAITFVNVVFSIKYKNKRTKRLIELEKIGKISLEFANAEIMLYPKNYINNSFLEVILTITGLYPIYYYDFTPKIESVDINIECKIYK